MEAERDPRNPDTEPDTRAEKSEPDAREKEIEKGSAGDGAISDEELDSVSGGMF